MSTANSIDRATVKRYLEMGLTQEQMVAQFKEETGLDRARSSFAVAISRHGLVPLERKRPRYEDTLPWRVRVEHANQYPARMLRALSKREQGIEQPTAELKRLESWLNALDEDGAVIYYEPETEEGFWRVHREPTDDGYIRVAG